MREFLVILPYIIFALVTIQTNPVGTYPTVLWTQSAVDLKTVQSYTYKYHLDGATTGQPLTGVTCSGTGTSFECSAKLPVTTPGAHTVAIETSNAYGTAISSSATFDIVTEVPTAPISVTIK